MILFKQSNKGKKAKKIKIVQLPPEVISGGEALEEESASEKSLTASVEKYGMLQPLIVSREKYGYRLLSGRRRLAAAETLNLCKVPCVVISGATAETEALMLSEELSGSIGFFEAAELIAEFCRRHSLNAEKAAALLGTEPEAVSRSLAIMKLTAAERLRLRSDEGLCCVAPMSGHSGDLRIKTAFADYRIFKNTIERTVERIRQYGLSAVSDMRESVGGVECVIRLNE